MKENEIGERLVDKTGIDVCLMTGIWDEESGEFIQTGSDNHITQIWSLLDFERKFGLRLSFPPIANNDDIQG